MNKKLKIIVSLFWVIIIGVVYASKEIDNLKLEISKISITRRLSLDKIAGTENEMEDIAQIISKLKTEVKESGNLLTRYRLEQILKKSETLDKKLKKEKEELTKINETLDKKNNELLKTYNNEINYLANSMDSIKDRKSASYAVVLKKLRDILKEKEEFIGLPADLTISFKEIDVSPLDSSIEIYEKIDTLKDFLDKYKKQLFNLEEQVKSLKERETLIREIKHFNEEIAFFSDEFVMHRSIAKASEKNPDTQTENTETNTQGETEATTEETTGNTTETDTSSTTPVEDTTGTGTETSTEQTTETPAENSSQNLATTETTPQETVTPTTENKISVISPYQSEIEFQRLTKYKNVPIREVIKSLEKEKKKVLNSLSELQNQIKEFEKLALKRSNE
jgi:hypothetical protein